MKANPGHFKPFSKVYGQNSTEEHLPTLTQTSWKCPLADGLKQRYARGFLTCTGCGKHRVFFSTKKLTRKDMIAIDFVKEMGVFMCGSDLGIPESRRSQIITTNQRFVCTTKIERQYYALKMEKPLVCHHCAVVLGDEMITKYSELSKKYHTVQTKPKKLVCVFRNPIRVGWLLVQPRQVFDPREEILNNFARRNP